MAGGSYSWITRNASVQAKTSSTARTMMLRKEFFTGGRRPDFQRSLRAMSGSLSKFKLNRASGPTRYEPLSTHHGMQGIRVLDLLLHKMVFIFGDIDVQTLVRYQAALVEWIFVRMAQRNKLIVLLKIGELQCRRPAHGLHRCIQRPFQVVPQVASCCFVGTL